MKASLLPRWLVYPGPFEIVVVVLSIGEKAVQLLSKAELGTLFGDDQD